MSGGKRETRTFKSFFLDFISKNLLLLISSANIMKTLINLKQVKVIPRNCLDLFLIQNNPANNLMKVSGLT